MRWMIYVAALALSACSASSREAAPVPENVIPEGLKDCKFYILENKGGREFHVIRCPNSSTSLTSKSGKSSYEHTMTTEDVASAPSAFDAREEHNRKVDEILKIIDNEIARLEAKKKELQP